MLPASNGGRQMVLASAVTVTLAVANHVLYKLALVPMQQYPFFMVQMTTFGYVAIYFSILYVRHCLGIVTKEMLSLPKYRFMAIGFLEALGVAAGMSSGAMLPGPAIPILSQTFLVWQLCFSFLILGRRYAVNQILGCVLVAAGVVIAVKSGANDGQLLSQIKVIWPALMVASSVFQAGASILKKFFIDAAKRLKGGPPGIFVVNSFGSGFQALFVFFLLPFLSNLRGISFAELPAYLQSGAACFINADVNISGCDEAPLLPILFMSVNIAFNISLLNLVKTTSALVASLSVTLSGCLQDVDAPIIRVSFMKLYQWPQSDAEFVRFISKREEKSTGSSNSRASWRGHENYASRQMYLRSYTFCRKEESVAGKTRKWLSEKKKTKVAKEKRKPVPVGVVAVVRRMKDKSVSGVCSVFEVVFECLFSCMARVDVVEFK